ncbi:hypothetical protein TD95_004645 [Thielaviopsis punctulata]|uniref:SUZ domain-containing protein n=1 Tax=Thielaviopsis punctulata TaxID=72032 RepID=A0A0F4ZK76_9PEZI|nr:hypothetical protein TD95_004645 [Thielaviopsis punctulata]
MASATLPKPTFAKVVASSPAKRQPPSISKPATMKPEPSSAVTATTISTAAKDAPATSSSPDDENLADDVAQLAISAPSEQNIESSSTSPKPKSVGDSDGSHRTNSFEIGTKPPSLDGKSVTSGTTTTLAMDEKDSLRPDDSASVQAAADDDDTSIRGYASVPASDLHASMAVANAQEGAAYTQPPCASSGTSDALENIYQQAPDDKLLEALGSTKDCQFLLRLEVDVISFVQESKEPYMDLPPSNSFFRMLTHKLADYYHMTHSYEKDNGPGFVRIFRTPFCRVPPSLASIAASNKSPTPPPPMIPMKIMRRGEDGEPAMSSASQSKATSEVGSEQKEKPVVKETRKTREEREEAYNEARKRIFGSSNATSVSNENGVSRASSVSTKDKSTVSARRPKNTKRRNSNGFESRHNYVPQWNNAQGWSNQPLQYVPVGSVYQGPPAAYPGQVLGPYPNGPPMNGPVPQGPAYHPQAYGPSGPYPPHAPVGRYPPTGPPMAAYGPPGVPDSQVTPQWQPNPNYRPQYGRGGLPPNAPAGANGVPYAYGQLPNNMNPYDVKSQHPIPGSYNRGFNPKTQSFTPNTGVQAPPQGMYPGGPPHHASPRMDSYTPYIPSPQMAAAQPYVASYGMPQPPMGVPVQMPPYMPQQQHHFPHQPMPHHGPHGHHNKAQNQKLNNNNSNSGNSGANSNNNNNANANAAKPKSSADSNKSPKPAASQSATAQPYGNLPHYGNPATLPQKPT